MSMDPTLQNPPNDQLCLVLPPEKFKPGKVTSIDTEESEGELPSSWVFFITTEYIK